MAIAQSQYVDLLVKQLYGVAKTDTATIKSPSNESIESPALIRGDTQWTQSDQIPTTAGALTGIVQAYLGVNAVECTPDITTVPVGGVYPTWLTNLTNWIPQQFGSTYVVQAWVDNSGVANPTLTGTQIFASGSGGTGEYYYDNIAGLLNFIGGTIPAALTSSKVIYIVGYRYIGLIGVTHLPSNTAIGNLNFTGTTISSSSLNGNIVLTPNGSGIVQVSSSLTSNGNITANFFIGNGSQLTGVAASNAVTSGTVTANAQPNITSVGTLISLDITGNLTAGNANLGNLVIANYFSGSGNLLSNIQGSNITGNVTSAITANFANYAGNVTASSQPNITSVGTLTSLDVTGNLSAGNITGANVVSANTFSGNLLATSANVNGNLISLNANLGNLAIANFFLGDGGLLTNVSAGNSATAGTVTDNAQPNITSVGTLISLDITGNLTAGNANLGNLVIANYFSGSGNNLSNIQGSNVTGAVDLATFATTANAVAGANVSGEVSFAATANSVAGANVSGQVANALIAGTVYTNAQPNITSVGNLTSLNVVGLSNLGPISNLTITGGTNGYYLQTDGLGGLSWSEVPSGTSITNGTSNVDISTINGNITMSVGGNANIVTITDTSANINGTLNVTGNIISTNANLGNAVTASYFIGSGANLINLPAANISGQVANALVSGTVYSNSQPNITSVGTLTSLDITGNITAGNANLGNAVSATYFVGNGSLLTGIATATTAAAVANGTSNVNIPFINGNINLSASGNANVLVVTGTGANITGTANVDGNLIATNIISGGGIGGSITGANLVSANYFTGTLTTNAQPNITSTGILTGLTISGHLTANTFQMGYDVYAFYSTSVYFATTASTANNQVLWSYTAADLSAIDFTIIATDATGSTRQTCKISAAILGTTVAFNEYGGLFINGGVGSFNVVYNGSGPTPTLDLVVTPDSSNLTEYNMLISKYLV